MNGVGVGGGYIRRTMGKDNGLLLDLLLLAVLPRQNINFPLIHSELANVCLQEEDVRALHAGIKYLGRTEVVGLASAHDLRATHDARQVERRSDLEHQRPVLARAAIDLVRCPNKFNIIHIHPNSFPYFDHVGSNVSDLVQIAS